MFQFYGENESNGNFQASGESENTHEFEFGGGIYMAKIIAICGKICCGKTYYANQIKEKEKAVILSCDELTKDLFDNDLGEKHDEMALRIWNYFKKKSVELVNIGCTVILD